MKQIKTDEHCLYIRAAWDLRKQLKTRDAVVSCDEICVRVHPRNSLRQIPKYGMIGSLVVKTSARTAHKHDLSLAVTYDCYHETPCLMIY